MCPKFGEIPKMGDFWLAAIDVLFDIFQFCLRDMVEGQELYMCTKFGLDPIIILRLIFDPKLGKFNVQIHWGDIKLI